MAGIVVGIDGSESSRQALAWAADEAAVRGTDLLAVQSWHEPMFGGPGSSAMHEIDLVVSDAKQALETIAATARDRQPGISVASMLADARPASALLTHADGADLLVVGSRGNGGFLGLELGTVSSKVARRAPVPIVVVRGAHDASSRPEVVVGVDGSDASRGALRWAADWAAAHDKVLVVRLAWNYLEPLGPHGTIPFEADYSASSARAALDVIVSEELAGRTDLQLITEEVCELPARGILERATDACLVVVGRRGKSRWAPPDLGATAIQVLHHATCPVAVIPDAGSSPDEPPTEGR